MPSTHFQLFKPDDLQTSDEVFVSVQISGLGTKQIRRDIFDCCDWVVATDIESVQARELMSLLQCMGWPPRPRARSPRCQRCRAKEPLAGTMPHFPTRALRHQIPPSSHSHHCLPREFSTDEQICLCGFTSQLLSMVCKLSGVWPLPTSS